jgi:hypothetical protein
MAAGLAGCSSRTLTVVSTDGTKYTYESRSFASNPSIGPVRVTKDGSGFTFSMESYNHNQTEAIAALKEIAKSQ